MSRLSWRRLRFGIRALYLLVLVETSLRRRGFGRTRDWLASRRRGACSLGAPVSELAWAVSAAARVAPLRAACLARSLVLWTLLLEQGIPSRLRFGAKASREGLLAHCWLEIDGQAINDSPNVPQEFPPLTGTHLKRER